MDLWLQDPADPIQSRPGQDNLVAQTPTGQSRFAYQLAAVSLILTALLTIIANLASAAYVDPELDMQAWRGLLSPIVDVALAVGLFRLSRGARTLTLIRAVAGVLLVPVQLVGGGYPAGWIIPAAMQLGTSGALILLLTGTSRNRRLVLSAVLYVTCTLVPFWVLILVNLLERLFGF